MDYEGRIKAYRMVAYSSVSFSLVALLSVAVGLSMLQSYVSQVGKNMDREIVFCQVSQCPMTSCYLISAQKCSFWAKFSAPFLAIFKLLWASPILYGTMALSRTFRCSSFVNMLP